MPTIHEVLLGHVLPGAICLIGLFVALWMTGKGRKVTWLAPILIGAAFTLGYYVIHPVQSFPPQDQSGWLVFAIPVLTILAALDSHLVVRRSIRAAVVLICAALFSWLLLVPPSNPRFEPPYATIAIVAAVIWITWFSLDRLSHRRGECEISFILLLTSHFNAAILGMSGSAIYGLQGGTLLAVTLALLIPICISRRIEIQRGVLVLFTFIWLGLLINGHFWSDVSLIHALLLLSAPLMGWLGELPGLRGNTRWKSLSRLTIVLIPLAIAAITAGVQFRKDMQELGY